MSKLGGIGLGLRRALTNDILERPPPELAWLEVAPENYMRRGGHFPAALARCAERWPIVTHGLCMSLGGADPLDQAYLATLREFLRCVESPWHSDHLSFGSIGGIQMHDLLPVPFTREMVQHLAARIREAQDVLGIPFAVENVSYYALPGIAEMDEGDFVTEVTRESGCGLMLDVNNVFVNARNHGFDPKSMLAKYPLERVVQIHVAGHDEREPELIIDTHAQSIRSEVYALLAFALERTGPVPVLLERDANFPPWDESCSEVRQLAAIWQHASERANGSAA